MRPRSRLANVPLRSRRPLRTSPVAAEARALLSLALAQSGSQERAAKLAEEARDAAEAAGDHWTAAVASLTGAMDAAVAGDVRTADALSANAARHSEAIGYLPTLLPATTLEAWVAEQREDSEAAIDAYRRVFELANQTRFADHAAFALARLGSIALANGEPRQAEELFRRALAAADAARAPWVTAYARVQLGRILAAAGDADPAERLYRSALEWSEQPRPHRARESLFLDACRQPWRRCSARPRRARRCPRRRRGRGRVARPRRAGVRLRLAVAAGRVAAPWQRRVGSFHPLADRPIGRQFDNRDQRRGD